MAFLGAFGQGFCARFLRLGSAPMPHVMHAIPRLSIVIPMTTGAGDLEDTLVSVLENRPDESEIVVVLARPYADPWNLRDEVRFVQAP